MDWRKKFMVPEHAEIKLHDTATVPKDKIDKATAGEELSICLGELQSLQGKLYAENKRSLLVVLQAMDAGGKDGVVRNVFGALNPQGCRAVSFKVPSTLERAHDFLWRIHAEAPKQGEICIFNRSHYEDVLITRVHNLISFEECCKRYNLINSFEELLAGGGAKVIKIFLHISKTEQLKRFLERLNDPAKNWKISEDDYSERQYWNSYLQAFEDVFSYCSTPESPWYIVPADSKSFRNLAVANIVRETLLEMNLQIPQPTVDLAHIAKLAQREMDREKSKL